ncbi:MAG: TfoX/Sxy family protein [Notoacmeibacter sp.]|nr:TfoX/Sxy family protein [Notoacmeibacter sp.]
MAYDETLAARIRDHFTGLPDVAEKRMMGGLVFMLDGHMVCGVVGDGLMMRVGADGQDEALAQPHAALMNMGAGRTMKGFIKVDPEGIATAEALAAWLSRGVAFVSTLPPK